MTYKDACAIAGLSKISGMLQALSCMEGATISKGLAAELECRAESLESYIGDLLIKDVKGNESTERAFEGII